MAIIVDARQRSTNTPHLFAARLRARHRRPSWKDEQVGTFYGRERAVRGPSLSLTLRLKNATCKTLEYAHRTEIDFDPEVGIQAYYSTGVKVSIKGKHLRQLFEDLARHAVVWIESRDALHAQREAVGVTGKPLPIVTDIIIERGRLDVDSGIWQPASGTWNTEQQTWVPRPTLLN